MTWWQVLRKRDRQAPVSVDESAWRRVLAAWPLLQRLTPDESERLRALSAAFLARKRFEPGAGCVITQDMRLTIATQACLPLLNLGLDYARGFRAVVLYPGAFRVEQEEQDEAGVVHRHYAELSGESWDDGPIVLSWTDVLTAGEGEGYNVVIHELAHKLDMLNGAPNGHPPLHRGMVLAHWTAVFTAAYRDLCEREAAGAACPIDTYAAEDPAEFFAVTSEYFFDQPLRLNAAYPEVYTQLQALYRQYPLSR